jgi:hypothetical protein
MMGVISEMKQSTWIVEIENAQTNEALLQLGEAIRGAGYTGFYEIQDYIREQFKRYEESDISAFKALVERVKVAVPEPGVISPSWTYFWDEIARMSKTKDGLFQQVTAADREGEWQVIIDNPFSHDNVACYPQLSFLEGAYLYCYFQLNLKKNEYVRLQKILTAVQTHGN